MARSIPCPQCGVVLNLPDQAVGRRLKCPKCETRFLAGATEADSKVLHKPTPGVAPQGDPNADTTWELSKKFSSNIDLPVMPTASGDLRETFDLPMMTEAASGPSKGGVGGAGNANRGGGDALALFDEKPPARRKKPAAEARSQARRCPTCGGVVPQGMSICQTCGLDLESGVRVGLDDDFAPTAPTRQKGIPLPIGIVGGLCFALGVGAAIAALGYWSRGVGGAQYFVPVAGFGIYASVQFLRQKAVKPLLVALSLGALIDLAALVALPIFQANTEMKLEARAHDSNSQDDPDAADEAIKPLSERLDMDKVKTGMILLGLYAAVSIYLLSPQVNRHIRR